MDFLETLTLGTRGIVKHVAGDNALRRRVAAGGKFSRRSGRELCAARLDVGPRNGVERRTSAGRRRLGRPFQCQRSPPNRLVGKLDTRFSRGNR